ncbi:hypothetical protein [Kordiimonas laminariae]|uniref:hypothetical protein n=1 Tax=Kordiimonas laminariae TaxID=2917717 RepID=UPI001FF3F89E|nr:hypothetical protein [Kordiimonas laminariae]MCK0068646.1 hypothetical protein [Kordiimonas laminariae]
MKKFLIGLTLLGGLSLPSIADDYWVTQLRAAPGKFPALLELIKKTDWQAIDGSTPLMMRHSQGNHWDVMLLGKHLENCATACIEATATFEKQVRDLVDSEVSFLATSEASWDDLQKEASGKGLYHIEMFNAAAGKHEALLRQRKIENKYLGLTGQVENAIFQVTFGTDVDIFTIGFHDSLSSFAAGGPESAEAGEKAAVDAGFKNRADISFHLRELIVNHHDTLAGPVK